MVWAEAGVVAAMRASNATKIASALANVPLDSLAPHRFTGFFYFDLKRVARCDFAIEDCIMLTDAIISRVNSRWLNIVAVLQLKRSWGAVACDEAYQRLVLRTYGRRKQAFDYDFRAVRRVFSRANGYDWTDRATRPAFEPPERLAIPVLRVDVQGSEIVITASDSDYMMTYHKPANSLGFSLNTSLGRKTGVSL